MKPADIPGMIEPVEQALLTELATYATLGSNGVVCEFGAYFGRSTACLAQGLMANPTLDLTRRRAPVLRTYDAFCCHRGGMLGRYVARDASAAKLGHLMKTEGDKLDFLALFDHFAGSMPTGLLSREATDIAQARHSGEPIVLMHVDAPKWYAEYLHVLRHFGPYLKVGSRIVFQDFFYHWSASVIGAVELMIDQALIEPMETAASSLLVKVVKPLDAATIEALDESYRRRHLNTLIESAVARFELFDVERRMVYLPRLMLAGMQSAFESGNFNQAHDWLHRTVAFGGNALQTSVMRDLGNLVEHGFAMRQFYELDLAAGARP